MLASVSAEMFRAAVREGVRRRRAVAQRCPCRPAIASRGRRTRPTSGGRRSSRTCRGEPARARRDSRARACWRCSATASRPITSRRPDRSRPTARPGRYLDRAGRGAEGLQLVRRAARQSRSDDARHVRQRAAAQSARARHRRRHGRRICPDGGVMSIYDASVKYRAAGVPLVVLAGKEYGSGSSRDWAAKGTMLLGVKAVIAESFERIHRSNLVNMGVLPLEFAAGRVGRVARPHGPRSVRLRRLRRGADAARHAHGRARGATTARRRRSRRPCASTRPRSSPRSGTAASCRTCCGGSRRS